MANGEVSGLAKIDKIEKFNILKGAKASPVKASPAISPDAISIPIFSILTFWLSLNPFLATIFSTIPLKTPPRKIAKVVSNGRYIPINTNIKLLTCMAISPKAISIPTIINAQGFSPVIIPFESIAIRPA